MFVQPPYANSFTGSRDEVFLMPSSKYLILAVCHPGVSSAVALAASGR